MDGISFLFLHVDYILLKLPISKEASEQHRMRERKSESLCDSWNNEMIVTKHLTNYKSIYDPEEKMEDSEIQCLLCSTLLRIKIFEGEE